MPKEPIPDVYQDYPVVTADRMRTIDHLATTKHGITVLELMENAGRGVAKETARYMSDEQGREIKGLKVVVFCGRGANGGDGLVAARALKEAGAEVSVLICPPKKSESAAESSPWAGYPEPVRVNLERADAAGVPIAQFLPEPAGRTVASSDVVVDALLGTGSSGKPAGPVREMIQVITKSGKPVVSVDIPSGLNPDTGHHSGVFVTAKATFTLGLPKRGLLATHARKNVGRLRIVDIGYPKELYHVGG